jgi:hypothetical protein
MLIKIGVEKTKVIKLKELITEGSPGFTKREFGDPLPTFKDVVGKHQTNESEIIDEGVIDDLLKKLMDKLSSGDQRAVKQISKKDPKFQRAYKQFLKARSDLESSLRANKGMYAPA